MLNKIGYIIVGLYRSARHQFRSCNKNYIHFSSYLSWKLAQQYKQTSNISIHILILIEAKTYRIK